MDVVEQLVRRFARRTTQNGTVVIITDGTPELVAAFAELGWPDPYPDPLLLPPAVPTSKVDVADRRGGDQSVSPPKKGAR